MARDFKWNVRNAIRTRNCKNLNDVKTVIILQKYKDRYGKFPNRQRVLDSVFTSDLHWIERKRWIDRVIDWDGQRGENVEWQAVLHNSVDVAKKLKEEKISRAAGENNPAWNHGGKFSIFSENFIGETETTKEDAIAKMKETKANNPQNENTKLEFYTSRGMSLEEAKHALFERQAVGRLEKFIERYGEDEGKSRWEARQEKWLESYNDKTDEEMAEINAKKIGRGYTVSNAEKEIIEKVEIVFGKGMVDRRLTLKSQISSFFVYDMRIGNKVIEYNGDYWHCNPSKYKEDYYHQILHKTAKEIWDKDETKKIVLEENGYELMVVWEADYKKDKEGTIQKCINFLKQ